MYLKGISCRYLSQHLSCHEESSTIYTLILISIFSKLVQEKYFYFISHKYDKYSHVYDKFSYAGGCFEKNTKKTS